MATIDEDQFAGIHPALFERLSTTTTLCPTTNLDDPPHHLPDSPQQTSSSSLEKSPSPTPVLTPKLDNSLINLPESPKQICSSSIENEQPNPKDKPEIKQASSSLIENEQPNPKDTPVIKRAEKKNSSLRYNLRPPRSNKRLLIDEQFTEDEQNFDITPPKSILSRSKKRVKRVSFEQVNNNLFAVIDPQSYHPTNPDEFAEKLLDTSKIVHKSQSDHFILDSKRYIISSWLTAVRIFAYNEEQNQYIEVKRIPDRYIKLSTQIVTSLHYSDSKLYIAYLWGGSNEEGGDNSQPFIEIRDTEGRILTKEFYYKHVIQSIYSDKEFVYANTFSNIVYIHQKKLFNCAYYCVDFSPLLEDDRLIGSWIDSINTNSITEMNIISATENYILLTKYDILSHKLLQTFKFDDDYKIISFEKLDNLVIALRIGQEDDINKGSKIELGYVGIAKPEDCNVSFVLESSITFSSRIIQMRLHEEFMYLFGKVKNSKGNDDYQIGCLYLPSLRPMWFTSVKEADENSQILPHDNNVAIIKDCQQISCIKTDEKKITCKSCHLNYLTKNDKSRHDKKEPSLFFKMKVSRNKFLDDVGACIFKKMPLFVDNNAKR